MAHPRKTMIQRAQDVANVPSKSPTLFWILGIGLLVVSVAWLIYDRLHGTHEKVEWQHIAEHWALILFSIAIIPGLAPKVGNGLSALASGIGRIIGAVAAILPWFKRSGGGPNEKRDNEE